MEDSVKVTSASELREILGEVAERPRTKVRATLDDVDIKWLEAASFCLIATSDRAGNCDVSPKGDPPGFTHVVDTSTIIIPDRPGNRRADGLHNILENGHVGLIYVVPGRGDTLRINGKATIVREAPVFDEMVVQGNRPALAIVVSIDEVFFHCSKAFLRSELWKPETWNPDGVPSRAQIALTQETTGRSLEEFEAYYGEPYRERLYPTDD